MKSSVRIKGSKRRLKNITDRKFKTCFIYPLAEFEAVFGSIWGHGLSEEELNTEQKMNKAKWDRVRMNILNKGNAQRRALQTEIDLYDVIFEGYHMEFRPYKEKNDGKDS
jgi:hypothetical protein